MDVLGFFFSDVLFWLAALEVPSPPGCYNDTVDRSGKPIGG
ncbi:MAG: hypothetical protein WCC53_00790 [Thermoanaerobaculia bacterium]|jgi:hypothetical protein